MNDADSLFMAGMVCGVTFALMVQIALRLAFWASAATLRRLPRAQTSDPHGNEAETEE